MCAGGTPIRRMGPAGAEGWAHRAYTSRPVPARACASTPLPDRRKPASQAGREASPCFRRRRHAAPSSGPGLAGGGREPTSGRAGRRTELGQTCRRSSHAPTTAAASDLPQARSQKPARAVAAASTSEARNPSSAHRASCASASPRPETSRHSRPCRRTAAVRSGRDPDRGPWRAAIDAAHWPPAGSGASGSCASPRACSRAR